MPPTALHVRPPLLLPVPRRIELLPHGHVEAPRPLMISGVSGAVIEQTLGSVAAWRPTSSAANAWLHCQVDRSVGGPEQYVLTVLARPAGQPQAQLNAGSEEGLRLGLHTLAQLLRQYGTRLPAVRLEDYPVFAVRGAMIDVSRDRVPTMAEAFRLVDQLSHLKFNQLQLYTEHTFAYRGHEEVWRHASPFEPREISDLDRHCAARGIRLVANQNCFGHLERWLKHPRYRPLAEAERWEAFGSVRDYPFTLCPSDPGSIALIDDLLGQLLPCFSTPMVNIGCDETFDLGQGRSKAEVAARGKAAVYLEFVEKVCALARKRGFRPLFWADIALEHPEALATLPKDLVALAWGYEADSPFAHWCSQLRSVGRDVWVCPGTSSWNSLVGRSTDRRANLLNAATEGAAGGATGYLVTDWGDHGHRQQWPIALAGLAEAAHRAWSGDSPYDPRAASLHAFGDRSLVIADWLDALGDCDRPIRESGWGPAPDGKAQPLRNQSALFVDLHRGLDQEGPGDLPAWKHTLDLLSRIPPPDPLVGGLDHLVWRECHHAWRVAELAATRAVCRRSRETRSALPQLADTLAELIEEHRDLWYRRSRAGGLQDSCAHYQRVLDGFKGSGS